MSEKYQLNHVMNELNERIRKNLVAWDAEVYSVVIIGKDGKDILRVQQNATTGVPQVTPEPPKTQEAVKPAAPIETKASQAPPAK